MKKLKFPYNCIELFVNDNQIKTEIYNKKNLRLLFDNFKFSSLEEDPKIIYKNIKIKLFNFLHNLFIDQVFLGNKFMYLSDLDIHWSILDEKFFIISNTIFEKR